MKKLSLFAAAMLLVVASCTDDQVVTQPDAFVAHQKATPEQKDEMKILFGKALASALAESPSFRELIKNEALKMFDNDYDVLWLTIKNTKLKEGITARELVNKHLQGDGDLDRIEKQVKLLTIFVPILPENTFSADLWNTETQIPTVGITSHKTNDVLMVDSFGKEWILKGEHSPAFPALAIKENERLVNGTTAPDMQGRTDRSNTFTTGDSEEFTFLADCFNGAKTLRNAVANRTAQNYDLDEKVRMAFTYMGTDNWQRDYIYYAICPPLGYDNGEYLYSHMEHLAWFKLLGGTSAYSKIADQTDDPKTRLSSSSNPLSGWTTGFYEFKVRVLLNGKNGVGNELITYFSAQPSDLFTFTHVRYGVTYVTTVTGTKEYFVKLPLFGWDLNSYSTSVKIDIEEVDNPETTSTSDTRSASFAMNFGFEGTIFKKIGAKLGGSLESTQTQTTTKTVTVGSDELGEVIVNFGDAIILSSANGIFGPFTVREYQTGWYSITVEPFKVQ
jgi:hypothetical protein